MIPLNIATEANYSVVSTILGVAVIAATVWMVIYTIRQSKELHLTPGDYVTGWSIQHLRSIVVIFSIIFGIMEAVISASTPGYSYIEGIGHVSAPARFGIHVSGAFLSAFFLIALPTYVTMMFTMIFEFILNVYNAKSGQKLKTFFSRELVQILMLIVINIFMTIIGIGLPIVNLYIIASGLHEYDILTNIINEYVLQKGGMDEWYAKHWPGWCKDYTPFFDSSIECPDGPKSASTNLLSSMFIVILHYVLDIFLGLNSIVMTPDLSLSGFGGVKSKGVHRTIAKNELKKEIGDNPHSYIKAIAAEMGFDKRKTKRIAREAIDAYDKMVGSAQSKVAAWLADTQESIDHFNDEEKRTLSTSEKKRRQKELQREVYDFFRSTASGGKGFGLTITGFGKRSPGGKRKGRRKKKK